MSEKPTVQQAMRYCKNGKISDPYILLEVLSLEVDRLRATLDDIVQTPYSMVNDSESLRHTLRQINAEAARSYAKSKS